MSYQIFCKKNNGKALPVPEATAVHAEWTKVKIVRIIRDQGQTLTDLYQEHDEYGGGWSAKATKGEDKFFYTALKI